MAAIERNRDKSLTVPAAGFLSEEIKDVPRAVNRAGIRFRGFSNEADTDGERLNG